MKRTIYSFSHPEHQNYHIQEYVFINNGCFDKDCDIEYQQTIEGFQVYLQYRYAISREGMIYDGNWLPQSAAWGHNTMNDVIGEFPTNPSPNDQFYDDGEIIRGLDVLAYSYELIGLGWVYYPLKIKLLSPLLRLVYRYWAKYRLQITGRSNIEKLCTSQCEQ